MIQIVLLSLSLRSSNFNVELILDAHTHNKLIINDSREWWNGVHVRAELRGMLVRYHILIIISLSSLGFGRNLSHFIYLIIFVYKITETRAFRARVATRINLSHCSLSLFPPSYWDQTKYWDQTNTILGLNRWQNS